MSKIVVIDGLARSGTTLLASLIHSQTVSKCFRGIFHEFLACDIGEWKRDYALYPLIKKHQKIKIIKDFSYLYNFKSYLKKKVPNLFKSHKFKPIQLSLKKFREDSLKNIHRKKQIDDFKFDEWDKLLNFSDFEDFEDFDNFYQELSLKAKVDLLAFRWNQGFPYCHKWLRNYNHYWISVIRHPIPRILSDNKTFNESFELGIQYTKNFAEIISSLNHSRHIKVYFDDLILNPKKTINHIFKSIGVNLPNVNLNLINQSGKEYKIESSDIIDKNTKHNIGRKFEGFEKDKLIVNSKALPKDIVEEYKKIMLQYSIYKRYL